MQTAEERERERERERKREWEEEKGFSIDLYMADILLPDEKVRGKKKQNRGGTEEEVLKAGRSWRTLGGCQQQHNRMREQTGVADRNYFYLFTS